MRRPPTQAQFGHSVQDEGHAHGRHAHQHLHGRAQEDTVGKGQGQTDRAERVVNGERWLLLLSEVDCNHSWKTTDKELKQTASS